MPSSSPGDATPSAVWRRSCRLLVGLVVLRGVVSLCVLPPFEGWDEYQHVGYVERVDRGEARPVLGASAVSPALMRGVVALPLPRSALDDGLARLGGVDHAAYWDRHDPRDPRRSPPAFRGAAPALYQAQHGPLYYRLAAPLFAGLGGVGNLRATVAGLRLANVALTAAAVALVLGLARRVSRSEQTAALLVLPLAAHPLFLLNGARVASDALGVLLSCLAVSLGVALALGRTGKVPRGWWALGLGAVAGLAVQAKATNLALLPFVAACGPAAAFRRRPLLQGLAGACGLALLIAGGFLATEWGDLRFNLAHYGMPTAMQEALVNRRAGRTPADLLHAAATFRWGREVQNLWCRELYFKGGWSFLRTATRATLTYQSLVRLGLLGWAVWGLRRAAARRWPGRVPAGEPVFVAPVVPWLFGVVVLGHTAALAYHMTQSKLAWGAPTTCPWYACPALPWFLALVAAGGLAWLPGRLRPALPWALAATGLAGEVVGVWGAMVPTYTGNAAGWAETLSRLAALQPAALGSATLVLALAAEAAVVAALVLTFRDAARSSKSPAIGGPHTRLTAASRPTTRATGASGTRENTSGPSARAPAS